MGGHRDAWGHGAMDPGGGTAVMLEASAAIGKQLQLGKSLKMSHQMNSVLNSLK